MTYTKMVNGQSIEMTAEEIAERQAEEAAWLAAREKYLAEEKYKDDRRAKLEPLDGDGMDAMRKAIESLSVALSVALPQEYQEYAAKVQAIKDMYREPVK
jgi:hypothetical protein